MEGSYQIDEFTTNVKAELARLKGQVDLFFHAEFNKYCELGLADNQTIAECGCGPGFLLLALLDRLPGLRATAVEIDPYLVDILKQNSFRDGKKLYDVQAASITDTGLQGASFDIVITRLVLEHLPDPLAAVKEMRRILKPEGKLIVVSNDFSLHLITSPHIPQLELLYRAYCASQFHKGGNPLIGRQLPVLLEAGGLEQADLQVICAQSRSEGDKAFFKAENVNISSRLVREGFLKKKDLDMITEKWHNMLKTDDHIIYRQLFIASGKKGTVPNQSATARTTASKAVAAAKISIQAIKMASAEEKQALLEQYLSLMAADVLETAKENITPDILFRDLGIDSVGAVEINNFITADFCVDVSNTDIMDELSIRSLTGLLLTALADNTGGAATTSQHTQGTEFEEGEL